MYHNPRVQMIAARCDIKVMPNGTRLTGLYLSSQNCEHSVWPKEYPTRKMAVVVSFYEPIKKVIMYHQWTGHTLVWPDVFDDTHDMVMMNAGDPPMSITGLMGVRRWLRSSKLT